MSAERTLLKILYIDPETAWGGGESEVIGLLRYLNSWGRKNLLLCHPEGILKRAAEERGIHTLAARIRNDLDMRLVLFLRRLIRSEEYDIVHFHTKRAHGLTLCLGHVRPDVRFVVTRRIDYPVSRSRCHDYLSNQRVTVSSRSHTESRRY